MRSAVASGPPRRSQMLRVEKHDDSRRRNGIRSRFRTALAGALGLALLAPLACGGSGSQARSTTTSRPGPDRAPIVLGLINMENSANGSFPEIRVAAQAAVRRIDDHGGIAGRPLRLLLIAFAFRMLMIVQTSVWRAEDRNWLVALAYFGQVAPAVICLVVGVVGSLMDLAWIITVSQVVVALAVLPSLRRSLRANPSRADDGLGEIPVGVGVGVPPDREGSQPEGVTS